MLLSRPETNQLLSNMMFLYERYVNQQLINIVTSRGKVGYPTSILGNRQVDQLLFNLRVFQGYIRSTNINYLAPRSRHGAGRAPEDCGREAGPSICMDRYVLFFC